METLHRSSTSFSYFPNACLTTLSASVTADDMLMASLSSLNTRNKDQYVAYTFPIADARENADFLVKFTLFPNKLKLFAKLVAAVPDDLPVLANLDKASVILTRFSLTAGALESSFIKFLSSTVSLGKFATACVDAFPPSRLIDVTKLVKLAVSNFNAPIPLISLLNSCNPVANLGKLLIALEICFPPNLRMDAVIASMDVLTELSMRTPDNCLFNMEILLFTILRF